MRCVSRRPGRAEAGPGPRSGLAPAAGRLRPSTEGMARGRWRRRHRCRGMTGSPGGEAGPLEQPLLREPGAFWGGFVAGALGLDLREEPLRTWLDDTGRDATVVQGGRAPAAAGEDAAGRDGIRPEGEAGLTGGGRVDGVSTVKPQGDTS